MEPNAETPRPHAFVKLTQWKHSWQECNMQTRKVTDPARATTPALEVGAAAEAHSETQEAQFNADPRTSSEIPTTTAGAQHHDGNQSRAATQPPSRWGTRRGTAADAGATATTVEDMMMDETEATTVHVTVRSGPQAKGWKQVIVPVRAGTLAEALTGSASHELPNPQPNPDGPQALGQTGSAPHMVLKTHDHAVPRTHRTASSYGPLRNHLPMTSTQAVARTNGPASHSRANRNSDPPKQREPAKKESPSSMDHQRARVPTRPKAATQSNQATSDARNPAITQLFARFCSGIAQKVL